MSSHDLAEDLWSRDMSGSELLDTGTVKETLLHNMIKHLSKTLFHICRLFLGKVFTKADGLIVGILCLLFKCLLDNVMMM